MKTMISDLPRDLVEEIFSRLPLKSMRKVRLTCRKWNNLLKSRSFTKMHISKAASETKEGDSMMIVMIDYNLYLMSVFVDQVDPSIDLKLGKLVSCLEKQVKISEVFHCDGLLLCILKDDPKVVVWNPYLGQTRWIEPIDSDCLNGWSWFNYALGYENKKSCRSYKFLRFMGSYSHAPENNSLWCEIYDFDSGLWKSTHEATRNWYISYFDYGVSLKGNTYFYASKWNSEDEGNDHIICFDFTKERFEPYMRLPFSVEDGDHVTLSCVREEKLTVLLQHDEGNPYELDIWITTKIDDAHEVSWIKLLRVETDDKTFIWGGFIIDEEKKVVMGFEGNCNTFQVIGEAGYIRQLDLPKSEDRMCQALVLSYVPSLVQIKQLSGAKRKTK